MENPDLENVPPEVQQAFDRIRPLCEAVVTDPVEINVHKLVSAVKSCSSEVVQEMQYYILYPFVLNLKNQNLRNRHETHRMFIDHMKEILAQMKITNVDDYIRYSSILILLIYDKTKPGMIAEVPEELKISVIQLITVMFFKMTDNARSNLYNSQKGALGQTIYLAVQMTKLEKNRTLKLESLECVLALTGTHTRFLDDQYRPKNRLLGISMTKVVSKILPGIMGGLLDAAVSPDNQGHIVITKSLNVIHRVMCMVMRDENSAPLLGVDNNDFTRLQDGKIATPQRRNTQRDTNSPGSKLILPPEFFESAGSKLKIVIQDLIELRTHDHVRVRLEVSVMCARILLECSKNMVPSIPDILDTLIALSEDDYEEVSEKCTSALQSYYTDPEVDRKAIVLDALANNFCNIVATLPRVMNNVDDNRKIFYLNLLRGYICMLSDESNPQRLSSILGAPNVMTALRSSLVEVCKIETLSVSLLDGIQIGDIKREVPARSPWCTMKHMSERKVEDKFHRVCRQLGEAKCAENVIDSLEQLFREGESRMEAIYLINHISDTDKVNLDRILNMYIEPAVWYLPLELKTNDEPPSAEETLDPEIYNPYEFTKRASDNDDEEIRYIDICLQRSRAMRFVDSANHCLTRGEAKENMVLSCLLTEGVGAVARNMKEQFQPYLLSTLYLLLERFGSKFEMLRLAGLKALGDVTLACGHADVTELVRHNCDYFSYQVTKKLKKEWNCVSALNVLRVIVEHSDPSIMHCLEGLVADMLVQSCDKFHDNEAIAYLNIFLTFVRRVRVWFPEDKALAESISKATLREGPDFGVLNETIEYMNGLKETKKLLEPDAFEKEAGKSVEEMYREDMEKKGDDGDPDNVPDEGEVPAKAELPQHTRMVTMILKRCVHLMSLRLREQKILAMQVMEEGLPLLAEDDRLPMVHAVWDIINIRVRDFSQPIVQVKSMQLLVTIVKVSKDFVAHRTKNLILPTIHEYLIKVASLSRVSRDSAAYSLTHGYKLQEIMLHNLGQLATDLGLQDKDLLLFFNAALPYLQSYQNKSFQAAAVKFYRQMLSHDYGPTWLYLRGVCDNKVGVTPSHGGTRNITLEPYTGTPTVTDNRHIKSNIAAIFDNYN